MHTVAVIQARMSSSRLPGKALMPLAGESMLARVVGRVTADCPRIDPGLIDRVVDALADDRADYPSKSKITALGGRGRVRARRPRSNGLGRPITAVPPPAG